MATQVLDSDGHPEWLSRAAFPFDSRYIDIDRKRIHYIDEGSGPALILISAGMWSFMFRDVVLRLRDQFRCVTLDFPGSGLSPVSPHHDGSVQANAEILEGFINSLDLQDITMGVPDAGGPIGFQVATRLPRRFRALVATNTFGWPIRNYAMARRMLDFVGSPLFGVLNTYPNILGRYTASSAGVGKLLSMADRKAFLGPWRARAVRRASQRAIAGAGRIDPLMAEIEQLLKTE